MTHQGRSTFRMTGLFVAVWTIAAFTPAKAAGEYIPPKMDEASCDKGATTGKDFTGVTSSDWYFIGAKPPCTSANSLKKYCAHLQTRNAYVFEEMTQAFNEDPALVNQLVAPFEGDDEAKAQALYSHPRQSLQKSLQKCGLTREQVRTKLVAEAETASKTDLGSALDRDFAVIGSWAPDLAMTIWKRECEGHRFADPRDSSENTVDKYWKANPRYLRFCSLSSADPMGKRPKDLTKVWTDISALSSE
jgi:hypothetical protein